MNKIEQLQELIDKSNRIVFFGGAGVSTASGIKDFRSSDGLYNMKSNYPVEYILSKNMFKYHTEEFFEFYKNYLNPLDIEPNITHKFLYELEKNNKLEAIITQNIDGLHTKAGNKKVLELHGSVYRNHCIKCNKAYDAKDVFESNNIPTCACGGIIKPDVVLYGEMLDEEVIRKTEEALIVGDLLIVAGTSLVVEPAASMIRLFKGNNIVIVNKEKTKYDQVADIVINSDMKEVFSKLKA